MPNNKSQDLSWIDFTIHSSLWEPYLEKVHVTLSKTLEKSLEFFPSLKDKIEISIVLADNSFIQTLNLQYRKKDSPTNVLSFPLEHLKKGTYLPTPLPVLLGDIILAYETIRDEADQEYKPFLNHLSHLALHGFLHLLEFDHETDQEAQEMENLEIEILKSLEISNPYLRTET